MWDHPGTPVLLHILSPTGHYQTSFPTFPSHEEWPFTQLWMPSNPEVKVTRGRIKNTSIDTTFQRREAKNGLVGRGREGWISNGEKGDREKPHNSNNTIPVKLRQEVKCLNNRWSLVSILNKFSFLCSLQSCLGGKTEHLTLTMKTKAATY